jgi:hypothetical protein
MWDFLRETYASLRKFFGARFWESGAPLLFSRAHRSAPHLIYFLQKWVLLSYLAIDMLKRSSMIRPMNRLESTKRAQIINCLIEGCSIRSTVRMTGAAKKTVMRALVEVGEVCLRFQDEAFRNLTSQRIQVDELWAFIYAKDKNVTPDIAAKHEGAGNIWLWVAIDADTKIVPCWYLGDRGQQSAHLFMSDLAARLNNRVQLTSDGHKAYLRGHRVRVWRRR